MNRLRAYIRVMMATMLVVLVVGCAGGTNNTPNPPAAISVVFVSQSVTSLQTQATTQLAASVNNDSANAGVRWTVTCGSTACGSFTSVTTASGAATTYTAPAAVPTGNTVTVTATSVTDTTKSASQTISITVPQQIIAVSFATTPPASLLTSTTASLTVNVANDAANAGVKWTVSCGSTGSTAPCGSFSSTTTASGTATTYTAPAAVPTGNTVTVTATSVTDATKSASASITITAPAPAVLADGTYVYNLNGQDTNGTYYVAGAFVVKSGAIISGEQDFLDPNGSSTDQLVASGSSITATTGNVQIVLATANPNVGVNGAETLRGTLVSGSRMLVTEFDNLASANGSIDQQTGAAALTGGYAFMVNGDDNSENQLAVGGVLNFNAGALSTSGSVFDFNDGGTVGQAQTFASGSVSSPDAFGRVSITLTPSVSTQPMLMFGGYIVGSRVYLVENTNDNFGGTLGGVALSQGANTGKFSQIGVAGQSYAFGVSGLDANGNLVMGGGMGLSGNGSMSGKMVFNDLAIHNGNSIAGSYTVDATGRVTVSNVTASNVSGATFGFQLYLDGNGNAVVIGLDTFETTGGIGAVQNSPGSDYEGNFAIGAQGILNTAGAPQWAAVGPVTISADNLSGFTDYNAQGYSPAANTQLGGSENSSEGLFSITGLNPLSPSSGYGYYPIDATHVMGIAVSDDQTGILMLEGVTVAKTR